MKQLASISHEHSNGQLLLLLLEMLFVSGESKAQEVGKWWNWVVHWHLGMHVCSPMDAVTDVTLEGHQDGICACKRCNASNCGPGALENTENASARALLPVGEVKVPWY